MFIFVGHRLMTDNVLIPNVNKVRLTVQALTRHTYVRADVQGNGIPKTTFSYSGVKTCKSVKISGATFFRSGTFSYYLYEKGKCMFRKRAVFNKCNERNMNIYRESNMTRDSPVSKVTDSE
jgi:hypothetical protein